MSLSLTLHGADELVTGSPDKSIVATSSLTGLTNYDSVSLNYYGVEPGIELEGDEIEYFSGLVKGKNQVRLLMNTEIKKISYPSTSTVYETLITYLPILKLKYKWISFDSNDKIDIHGSSNAVLVSLDIRTEYDKEKAGLYTTFEMKKGYKE